MELELNKGESETNFGSEVDLNQISDLNKQTGDQIKSLIDLLITQADD